MDSHYENITELLGLSQGIRVTIMNHVKAEGGREMGEREEGREGGRRRKREGEREKEGGRECVPVSSSTHIHTMKAESYMYIAHIKSNIISST